MASYQKETAASLNAVSTLVDWAETAAQRHSCLPDAWVNACVVCIHELVFNVALYAERLDGAPIVRVSLRVEDNGIVVSIEDNGQPFDPMRDAPDKVDTDLASAEPGGRGVRIVRRMARVMSYLRAGDWNCVRLEIA